MRGPRLRPIASVPKRNEMTMSERRAKPDVPLSQRALLSAVEVAALWGCSRSMILAANRDGLIPAPIVIGKGLVRWRAAELRDWLAAGCPPREGVGVRRWHWAPCREIQLTEFLAVLEREAADLSATIADVK